MSAESKSIWTTYIFSTDHKTIGKQYLITAFFMALFAVGWSMLIRVQIAFPDATWPILSKVFPNFYESGVLLPERYLSMVTMHGTIMVFFVISFAIIGGFGNFLIPLQVGAQDMAYPFLNMLSYWVGALASVVMIGSVFLPDGPAASGWTAYPPLSALPDAIAGSGMGQTLWILAMALFIASFTMGGLNYITTILNCRTRGLSMMRMSMTMWTMLVASILGILAFPALTAAAIMLLLDRIGGTSFFLPEGLVLGTKILEYEGGTPLLFQHLFWFLGHPEVYVLALPAIGITFDIVATMGRRSVFGYRTSVWSLLIIGVLSMIVWGHHMFTSGMNPYIGEYFSIATVAITIPFAVLAMNLIAGLWRAKIILNTAMLFSLAIVASLGVGGLGGLWLGTATSDMYLHDSYFVVGHFHFMIGIITGFSILAGVYFWYPKMFGRHMSERLGKWHFWLSMPVFPAFLAMHWLGMAGHLRRSYDPTSYEYALSTQWINVGVTAALVIAAASQVLFLVNFAWSRWRGKVASENPWNSASLEWTTPSPAPHLNWAQPPTVYRGPYEYRLNGGEDDFVPQHIPVVPSEETV